MITKRQFELLIKSKTMRKKTELTEQQTFRFLHDLWKITDGEGQFVNITNMAQKYSMPKTITTVLTKGGLITEVGRDNLRRKWKWDSIHPNIDKAGS